MDKPCVALLGEPGIGKSISLRTLIDEARGAITSNGDRLAELDLRDYTSDMRLESDLLHALSTRPSTGSLHLFLDSLDECRISIPSVASLILTILKRRPSSDTQRLRLRIACRTADWPLQFDSGFPQLFGENHYVAYELLPLRAIDVAQAARNSGTDADAFLKAVEDSDAQPLASKPITLRLLLQTYQDRGSLPRSQVELYRVGCRLLCTEASESRRDSGRTGTHTPDQRLAVACRIAAILALTRHVAVSTRIDPIPSSSDALPISSLVGGRERANGNEFEVDERAIHEAINTGLFSSRGSGQLGFSHQTYAEYLAAQYLVDRRLDLPQLLSLLCHSGDPERRVVPQLSEMAAWLASMNRGLFKELIATDPHVLLQSDAATSDSAEREALLSAHLDRLSKGHLTDANPAVRRRYGRFAHAHFLDRQLAPFILRLDQNTAVRRAAIEIAEAAMITDLQDALLAVATNEMDNYYVRSLAARAIAEIGDAAHRLKMRALLEFAPGADPDDQLRGSALHALWRDRLVGIDEVLAAIKPPQRRNFAGWYDWFLSQEFAKRVSPGELPRVLHWLSEQTDVEEIDRAVGPQRLSDEIVLAAWKQVDDEKVRDALAGYTVELLKRDESILSPLASLTERAHVSEDAGGRRALVQAIVMRIDRFDRYGHLLVHGRFPLLRRDDLAFVLDVAVRGEDETDALRFAQLAAWLCDYTDSSDLEQVLAAADRSHLVRQVFAPWISPVQIGSEEARRLKEAYEGYQVPRVRRRAQAPPNPPLRERVETLLGRLEAGESDAWPQLNHLLLFRADGEAGDHNELEDDLRLLPGWEAANDSTKARLINGAKLYLQEAEIDRREWLGTNLIHDRAFSAYRALALLAHEDPAALDELSSAVWAMWAAAVLGFPVSIGVVGEDQPALKLAALAYHHAPEQTIEALNALIDFENASSPSPNVFILRRLEGSWDARLCVAMLAKASNKELRPGSIGDILDQLLIHQCGRAEAHAKYLVESDSPIEVRQVAALSLLRHAADAGWSVVWPAIESDETLGRWLMESFSKWDGHTGKLADRLTENQTASLCIWLERHYPRDDDPRHDTAHFVGPRESVAHFRDAIVRALAGRGTTAAVAAIQRILDALPHLDWLRYLLSDAKETALRQTWAPPTPAQVLALCLGEGSALVRSGAELLAVLVDALDEIARDLQGETPAAPELWNIPTGPSDPTPIRPKDENRLSDWLKRRLMEKVTGRGIIALREVEIRRGEGVDANRSSGERTDLHVTGIVDMGDGGYFRQVRVIIEVKGCWHSQLRTAMESQLVGRYLKDNDCRHGLYVVFWFRCPQWDSMDSRYAATPAWAVGTAATLFSDQAKQLSTGLIDVRSVVLNSALH